MDAWQDLVERIQNPKDEVTLHFVGKYTEYEDSYKSINEALFHGGFRHRLKVKLKYVEAEALEEPDGMRLLDDAVGHSRRARIRRSRQPRHDGRGGVRPHEQDPLFRDLLRVPVGRRRIRAQRRAACRRPTRRK